MSNAYDPDMKKLMTLNKPDVNGQYRVIPLPPKGNGKPRPFQLAARRQWKWGRHCPVGSFSEGADRNPCRCLTDKLSCTSPFWSHMSGSGFNAAGFRKVG